MDPLSLLARKDKWFLAGGSGALYAPPFPRNMTTPGFWDECFLADVRLPRVFGVLFLDKDQKPVRLTSSMLEWRPDCLTLIHQSEGVSILERRCVTEGNAWVSEFTIEQGNEMDAFVWSLLDVREFGMGTPWASVTDVRVDDHSIDIQWDTAWPSDLQPDRSAIEAERITEEVSDMTPVMPIFLRIGASGERLSWSVNLAQRHDESPLYELSILPQKLVNGCLPGELKFKVGVPPIEGLLHIVQHYRLSDETPLIVAAGSGLKHEVAVASFTDAVDLQVLAKSTQSWRAYFDSVPSFACSDAYLTHAYWYRWYGLRLNVVNLPDLPISGKNATFSPFISEGIGFFRNFVTYSAQAHLREVGWMHDPQWALGIVDNLSKCQRGNGSFPGHNYSVRPSRDFYHADFATGLRQLKVLHAEIEEWLGIDTLKRYADYFLSERLTPSGFAIFDQNETGQEYMSRYLFATPDADQWTSFKVVGVDAVTYMVLLFESLNTCGAGDWGGHLESTLDALIALYDREHDFFCDSTPEGRLSPARPATGLYALLLSRFLVDRLTQEQLVAVAERWMLNPNEFWLQSGFPATAKSDPFFSADGEWKERRLNCPWSGRSWPMANSHLVDGLCELARQSGDSRLREAAAESVRKTIHLMFHDKDASRPNSYEHYDPESGIPALYRGYDDYMHSWVVDLILRHVVGVIPGSDSLDPLPLGLDWLECSNIPNCGRMMHVTIEKGHQPLIAWD